MIYPTEYKINGTMYNVDALFNGELSNDETAKRQFLGQLYHQYNAIRMIKGGKKCQKTHIDEVKKWLELDKNRERVRIALRYTDKQIDFIMFLAENEIPFVR